MFEFRSVVLLLSLLVASGAYVAHKMQVTELRNAIETLRQRTEQSELRENAYRTANQEFIESIAKQNLAIANLKRAEAARSAHVAAIQAEAHASATAGYRAAQAILDTAPARPADMVASLDDLLNHEIKRRNDAKK